MGNEVPHTPTPPPRKEVRRERITPAPKKKKVPKKKKTARRKAAVKLIVKRALTRKKYSLSMNPSDTIRDVKQRMEALIRVAADSQTLTFHGTVLDDAHYVSRLKKRFAEGVTHLVVVLEEQSDTVQTEVLPTVAVVNESLSVIHDTIMDSDVCSLKAKAQCLKDKMRIAKSASMDKKSGFSVMPVTYAHVIHFTLVKPYCEWHAGGGKSFVDDLAQELGVDPSDLVILSVAEGSTNLCMMDISTLNYKFKGVKIEVAAKYENLLENVPFLKKHALKKAELVNVPKTALLAASASALDVSSSTPKLGPSITFNGAEEWLRKETGKLREELWHALKRCSKRFYVLGVVVLENTEVFNDFIKHGDLDNCRVLYHGKEAKYFEGILDKGFLVKGQLDPGWFGDGYYFTAFPQYAMHYISFGALPTEGHTYTLVVSHVNVGNVREISKLEIGKPIPDGFDTNYVKVGVAHESASGCPYDSSKHSHAFDEWCVRDRTRILPRYLVTLKCIATRLTFVWRDAKIENEENSSILSALKASSDCAVLGVKTTEDALYLVKCKKKHFRTVHVITNGADDGDKFVAQLYDDLHFAGDCMVFTSGHSVTGHRTWAKRFDKCSVTSVTAVMTKFVSDRISQEL